MKLKVALAALTAAAALFSVSSAQAFPDSVSIVLDPFTIDGGIYKFTGTVTNDGTTTLDPFLTGGLAIPAGTDYVEFVSGDSSNPGAFGLSASPDLDPGDPANLLTIFPSPFNPGDSASGDLFWLTNLPAGGITSGTFYINNAAGDFIGSVNFTTVPEPGTVALLVSGGLGATMLLARRRRK